MAIPTPCFSLFTHFYLENTLLIINPKKPHRNFLPANARHCTVRSIRSPEHSKFDCERESGMDCQERNRRGEATRWMSHRFWFCRWWCCGESLNRQRHLMGAYYSGGVENPNGIMHTRDFMCVTRKILSLWSGHVAILLYLCVDYVVSVRRIEERTVSCYIVKVQGRLSRINNRGW